MLKLTYSRPADLPDDANDPVDPCEYADLERLVGRLALTPATIPATVQAVVVQKSFAGLCYQAEGRAYLLMHCPEVLAAPAAMRAVTAERRYLNA